MITRVHKGGATFSGLARYLTRGDRHDGIETINLVSRDARTSARIMKATADDSTLLKQLAGGSARGRPLKKPCHHFTGSWHPSESPSDEEMYAFGRRCTAALGFDDRQAVMVIHRDKTYRGQARDEIHVMTNRVSPENGIAAPDADDGIKLAALAKQYEQEQEKIFVRSRFEPRPSAERERKRMRLPDGTAVAMTAEERSEFSALKRRHKAERVPKNERDAELKRLGSDVRELRELRAREGTAPPSPVPPPIVPIPKPERPRADLDQVRIEPEPVVVPPPIVPIPKPERPRADLDQVRIEPEPVVVPPPIVPIPKPERPRADLDQVLAAAAEEQAQAVETRRMFQAATSLEAVEYEADQVARDLAARQPKDLPWDKVTTALLTQHSTEQRYTQRMKLGQGVTLDTGVVREQLEGQILDRAPRYRFRAPPVLQQKGLAAAISAAVKTIQDAVDQVVDAILDHVLPDRGRNPAPDAGAVTAPEQREASADAQVGEGRETEPSPARRAAARETTTREKKGGAATPYDDEHVVRAPEAGPGGTDRKTKKRSTQKRSIPGR